MSKVVVEDYDPGWPLLYEQIRAVVWPAMNGIALSIEHVGSTSVPGLAAKPIVDVDVVVPQKYVALGIERLEGLGYRHRGDLGIPGREAFSGPTASPKHHLYLCSEGSAALANHLAVRDYLRSHPSDALAYGELKKRLARDFADDIAGYIDGKTAFLVEVLRRVGFDERAITSIEQVNRKP